ncbi:hypothetical protein AAFF_G00185490 [Aldrovandia affinis]|uniref:G-protein coupled receptors family 1 profile domain-containing protein n=1 Tax=Aldrovandia affinis TaxID=143900 RepID=A0AAD7W6T3_9TELE|nr:hypothetical protein AAFF_G00185490 [Aldrovandia affinis]
MAAASYDQLLKQVEALKMENSNLRQELQDNSNHLTKLETEATNMKEVLKQLQGNIEEESMESSGQIDFLERLKEMTLDPGSFPGVKMRPKVPMRYDSREGSLSGRSGDSSPVPTGSFPRRAAANGGRESSGYLEELEKERSLLLAELEKEEKEKDWYYAQLQNLTKRIDSLPLTENFSLQTDMTRRQLEYEARQIRAAMEEQLGTCQDMEKRAQARVARIQQIEKDMLRIRQHLQSQQGDPEKTSQSKHEAAPLDSERPGETGQASDTGMAAPGCGQVSSSRMDHEAASEMSCGSSYSVPRRLTSHLGTKVTEDSKPQVEMVYSLLSMLGTHDKDDMSRTLLAMSSSQDSCIAMRQSGCLPLLIQLLHGNDKDSVLLGNSRGSKEARARASAALHNIIHSQPDDKRGRREIRVLHLLEQIRAYCETCWEWQEAHERGVDQDKNPMPSPVEHQICPAVCVLMKLSFDEEHRHAMNELGGLQAIGELLQVDCEIYGLTSDHYSVTLRRYAGMALTNLTFGDVANKATLCSMKGCMRAMVAQLKSESEDLQQVIASVLRNLSWRADVNSKKTLREVGSVKALTECALNVKKESTLKSVLSALWNLSAHCTENKADICAVDGALAFLVSTLTYRSQTNTLAIIESGGGILRNVSSLIATNEDHRQILRENNCLQTLLQHLKSHSLTIVSNACGTLWNLSARNAKDQESLWEMGAVSMLKNLIHSKHKMIAMGSAAALRNLMANRPAKYKDANIMSPGSSLPSLHVRKQKALIEELDAQHLSETFDNIDNLSPKALHRSKPRHKQSVYNEYVLEPGRHNDDSVCRPEGFNSSNLTVLSPYMNMPVLSSSSRESRGNSESSRAEKDRSLDRERRGGVPGGFHPSDDPSKRMGMQISTAAHIAKVMEEVQSMHIGQDERSAGTTQGMHCVEDEMGGVRRTPAMHAHSNVYNFSKPEHPSRNCPMPKMEYRASNDSLNSVSSSDGYDKRGQMKPSIDSYSEDEGKCCIYRKYPADLAHKIHSANHMEDDDGDLDTPINYSLKYSDEQLNSGRQSPSQNESKGPRILKPGEKSTSESKKKEDEVKGVKGENTESGRGKRNKQAMSEELSGHGSTNWTLTDYELFKTFYDTVPSKEVTHPMHIVSIVLYSLTCLVGIPGNAFVIWIAGFKMKRTVNIVWFLNLASADFLCCLSIPFSIVEIVLDYHWPYGKFLCRVIPTVIILSMFASVFTLTLISLDRFALVIKPIWSQNHRSVSWAYLLCGTAWFLALLLSLPSMIYRELYFDNFTNTSQCKYNRYNYSNLVVEVIPIPRFVLGFMVPLFVIVTCYSFIGRKLSSSTFSQSKKAIKIILGVIVAFFVCWLPYHVVGMILWYEYGSGCYDDVMTSLDPLSISLAYLNSCLNPILYVFMGQDFKEKVKISLRRAMENAFSEDMSRSTIHTRGAPSQTTNSNEAQF